jgi:hypothetical protein
MNSFSPNPELRVIQGGQSSSHRIGAIEVVPATLRAQPFTVDIRVLEEDTWLIMGSAPILHETTSHPIRVMTDLIDQQPHKTGDVLLRGRQWLAVVYDLDQEPLCRAEWITSALQKILALSEQKGIIALALPLLGSTHGPLSWEQSLEIITNTLREHEETHLRRIWLIVNKDQLQPIQDRIETA